MAAIYLRHPVHGAKVATAEAEAAYDERSGWVRYDPDTDTPLPPVHHHTPEIEAGHNHMFHQTPRINRGGRPKGSKNKPKET